MRIRARWFQITGIFILLQFVLGGLVSANFMAPLYHVVLGFVVVAFAVVTLVVALSSKPSSQSLKLGSALLVVLVVLQVPLGFVLLDTSTILLLVSHVANAIAILATVFTSYFVARKWEKKSIKVQELGQA